MTIYFETIEHSLYPQNWVTEGGDTSTRTATFTDTLVINQVFGRTQTESLNQSITISDSDKNGRKIFNTLTINQTIVDLARNILEQSFNISQIIINTEIIRRSFSNNLILSHHFKGLKIQGGELVDIRGSQ